ncbi:MAG: hypothetical protein M0R51_00180 [Clostridia bacterium]|jgi:hypothetical protein|nr:hypothetical protein [Clostridia bacterium]
MLKKISRISARKMQDFCKGVVLGYFLFAVCCMVFFVQAKCLKAFVCGGYSGFTKRHFVIKNGIKNEPAITVIKPFGTKG